MHLSVSWHRFGLPLMGALLFVACGDDPPAKAAPAAKVANPTTESQLTAIMLSTEAVGRLGIATATIDSTATSGGRTIGGVVVVPPGHSLVISAPVAGTILSPARGSIPQAGARVTRGQQLMRLAALPPDRELLRTDESLAVAKARFAQADREATRTASLHADRLVSTRDHERAQADLAAAKAALETAESQQRLVAGGGRDGSGMSALVITAPANGTILTLGAGPGQTVAAGAALAEVVELDQLWVKVPVFSGDASLQQRRGGVVISSLADNGGTSLRGVPVQAPPTADAGASSVDLYYAIQGGGATLRPGQRVSVTFPDAGDGAKRLTVPAAAVVHDIYGGAWVYERVDSVTFTRRRVEVVRVDGARAVLARGPASGTVVVTSGAAELFGVEFGPGK